MKFRVLAFVWMLIVLAAMSIPGQNLPIVEFRLADKLIHALCFFGIAWLWMHALGGSWRQRALWTLAISVGFAIGTEVYQGVMPIGRSFDPFDVLADMVGAAAAILLAKAPLRRKEAQHSNASSFIVS